MWGQRPSGARAARRAHTRRAVPPPPSSCASPRTPSRSACASRQRQRPQRGHVVGAPRGYLMRDAIRAHQGGTQRPSVPIRMALRVALGGHQGGTQGGHPMYRVARQRQRGRSFATVRRVRERGRSPREQSRSGCTPGVLHSPSDLPNRCHVRRVQGRKWTVWACGARGSRSAGARVRSRRAPLRARASHYASGGPGCLCLSRGSRGEAQRQVIKDDEG